MMESEKRCVGRTLALMERLAARHLGEGRGMQALAGDL